MGKKRKTLILVIGIISILGAYSQDKLVNANNNFAFKIYKATKPDSTNFFISPFSLHLALAIANEGANTTTRQEIDKLLFSKLKDGITIYYQDPNASEDYINHLCNGKKFSVKLIKDKKESFHLPYEF